MYWPKAFTLEHFNEAINGRSEALTLLRNSLVYTISSVALAVVLCAFGGYALSRGHFKYKRLLMFAILLIQVIPGTATILPFYLIMRQMHLVDTVAGLMIGLTVGQRVYSGVAGDARSGRSADYPAVPKGVVWLGGAVSSGALPLTDDMRRAG